VKKALIIGGGFAGCAAAHQLELLGNWEVTLIETASFLGAGNKTRWYGGHPYTFGPRHFLTPYENVYRYLDGIIPMRRCQEHEFVTYVESDRQFYAYPINMDDVEAMPDYSTIKSELRECERTRLAGPVQAKNLEDYWIQSVGKTLYGKMVDNYNKKMWQVKSNVEIDTFSWSPKGVALKRGSRAAWDNIYSAYPYSLNGYDDYFPFATKNVKVCLNTRFEHIDVESRKVRIAGEVYAYDLIINTIGPDTMMAEAFGPLQYLGRKLHLMVLPVEYAMPTNVYFVYYANTEEFTRLVEYKKFTKYESKQTLLGMEIPQRNGGRDYPMPFQSQQRLAEKYFSSMGPMVYSMGRAGSYLYGIDIDDCIRQAMLLADELSTGAGGWPVPGLEYRFPEMNRPSLKTI
jgi:UDP-galactopyranose mutase